MTEYLLQYLWNYKVFNRFDFKDTNGNAIEILDFGFWNKNAGADFQMAKIKINDVILVGHIELHIKSSDWILHQHSQNFDYDNVILHAVYHHDVEVKELADRNIPTLELKRYIDKYTIRKYAQLKEVHQFIPCEKIFSVDKIPFQFSEEKVLEKLNDKSQLIEDSLVRFKNDYEAVLFHYIAYAFGLKINAEIFKQLAESLDFSIINKVKHHLNQLEALLFGRAGWLSNSSDESTKIWKREFDFLKTKYQLSDLIFQPKFLRLRPFNFPTIRLAQLANLYYTQKSLFSKIIEAQTTADLVKLFSEVKASDYWDNHYNFGKISGKKSEKTLTKSFIDLLFINAILPIRYTYYKNFKEETADDILAFYEQIKSEQNTIVENWKTLNVTFKNSLDSQAYIYHYKNFCEQKKCLNCTIGFNLLK